MTWIQFIFDCLVAAVVVAGVLAVRVKDLYRRVREQRREISYWRQLAKSRQVTARRRHREVLAAEVELAELTVHRDAAVKVADDMYDQRTHMQRQLASATWPRPARGDHHA